MDSNQATNQPPTQPNNQPTKQTANQPTPQPALSLRSLWLQLHLLNSGDEDADLGWEGWLLVGFLGCLSVCLLVCLFACSVACLLWVVADVICLVESGVLVCVVEDRHCTLPTNKQATRPNKTDKALWLKERFKYSGTTTHQTKVRQ